MSNLLVRMVVCALTIRNPAFSPGSNLSEARCLRPAFPPASDRQVLTIPYRSDTLLAILEQLRERHHNGETGVDKR